MNSSTNIQSVLKNLLKALGESRTTLAKKIEVSESTVSRWISGKSAPRPLEERRIRLLAEQLSEETKLPNPDLEEQSNIEAISNAIDKTLQEVRETLHRSGRLSSRQESLDELAKLIFSHFISIKNGGHGIYNGMISRHQSTATTLRDFTRSCFLQFMPESLSHELSIEDFCLNIKDSENQFARELINAFDKYTPCSLVKEIQGSERLDILNDVFGKFLADSFIEEKELGQYLTPSEVVKIMTKIGLYSLNKSDYDVFLDRKQCINGGFILDPSCGVGSFLAEIIRHFYIHARKEYSHQEMEEWTKKFLSNSVVGIDKSERMIRFSLTNLALFGVSVANLHLANSLRTFGRDIQGSQDLKGRVKLILTNPPFGAEFFGQDIKSYKIASRWSSKTNKSVPSEVLFIERYIDWLAPNGILVAIVPDSILTNRGIYKDLRDGIKKQIQLLSVISLPPVTFGVAGTHTKTSILHLKKVDNEPKSSYSVYFGICENIGYEVSSRGTQRKKIKNGDGDLEKIAAEVCQENSTEFGQYINFSTNEERWDANFHNGLAPYIREKISKKGTNVIKIKDIAILSDLRQDPRRQTEDIFKYIEISDLDSTNFFVGFKEISSKEAPSRARKLVYEGDVIVSTVRPERKTVAVIPKHLDSSICSTGFAVLRPFNIDSYLLAFLLRSDFVNQQILRNNAGIAYPAISEECLLNIILPIEREDIDSIQKHSDSFYKALNEYWCEKEKLNSVIDKAISCW